MTDDELRLPAPPSDYSAAEREAWFEGARTVAAALSSQAGMLASAYDNGPVDDAESDADGCPECENDELVTPFGGGERCNNCGYTSTE